MSLDRNEVIRRYEGSQSFLKDGCLFLSLCSIAEEVSKQKLDILDVLAYCKKMGYVLEDNNMTVEGQCNLLRDLTGKVWKREVMKELPRIVPEAMWTVEKWLNSRTGYMHFKRRFMDTLKGSVTVKEGALVAYYCYTHM